MCRGKKEIRDSATWLTSLQDFQNFVPPQKTWIFSSHISLWSIQSAMSKRWALLQQQTSATNLQNPIFTHLNKPSDAFHCPGVSLLTSSLYNGESKTIDKKWKYFHAYNVSCYPHHTEMQTGLLGVLWSTKFKQHIHSKRTLNTLNAELNPIFYLLALLAHHFLHVSGIRVKSLTLRLLMSYIYIYIYIYGAPILDVSRSHTTTQHSR